MGKLKADMTEDEIRREREYRQRPEVKEREREYRQRPEVMAANRNRSRRKAKLKTLFAFIEAAAKVQQLIAKHGAA